MAIAIDASSLINLSNAEALELTLGLPDREFLISPLVAGECHVECVAEIIRLTHFCPITLISDDQLDAELYLSLLADHELGAGETECITLCQSTDNMLFCCDDRKARQIAIASIGQDRVIGSLRLLKWAVEAGRTTSNGAYQTYMNMKAAGGFLPSLDQAWFDP